jgi:hypothetical protein
MLSRDAARGAYASLARLPADYSACAYMAHARTADVLPPRRRRRYDPLIV